MIFLEDLDFADDLVPLPHRIHDMRDKMRALEKQGVKVGLKINVANTKLMHNALMRQNWKREHLRGVRQKILLKIG